MISPGTVHSQWRCRYSQLYAISSGFRRKVIIQPRWTQQLMRKGIERKTLSKEAGPGELDSSDTECRLGKADLKLPQGDEHSWTALICRHTKCGRSGQALEVYEQLRNTGVKLSSYAFVAVLKACTTLQDLESCKSIHADIIQCGFESNVFVGTMLVVFYGKCGSLQEGRRVFEKISHRNVVSWNSMIWAYAQRDEGKEALLLYARMQREGVVPDDQTLVGALKACSSLATLEHGTEGTGTMLREQCLDQVRAIHLHAVMSGYESNMFLGTMLVDAYGKCGHLVDARAVFEKMSRRNVVSWTVMILGYVQMKESWLALQLYARMQHEGIMPNERTFVGALKACSNLARLGEANKDEGEGLRTDCLEIVRAIHSQILKSGCEGDTYVGNTLVDAYAKCGSLVDARRVFDRLPHRDVVSWNAMILGYTQSQRGEDALYLYSMMRQEGVVQDDRTYFAALKACSSMAGEMGNKIDEKYIATHLFEQVRAIHSSLLTRGFEADGRLGNMLVNTYVKCGSLVDARNVFERMSQRDVVSWTTIILGYAQMEEGELALQLFAQMQQEGVVPNHYAFIGAIKACGSMAALDTGKKIHAQMLEAGLDTTDLFTSCGLIDMYGKCGSMVDAEQVFDALPSRNIFTWSALIAGYARIGEIQIVFNSFKKMTEEGIQPDAMTFLIVLSACSHVGLVDKGEEYFKAMHTHYGITPTMEHYNCMVDLLGREGQVNKAIALVKVMPFQPPCKVWRSVLAACQKWSDVDVGERHWHVPTVSPNKIDAAPSHLYVRNLCRRRSHVEWGC